MVKAAPVKKLMFAAGSFDDLRSASGEATGAPLRLALSIIDEDPNQPRKQFDADELGALAESILLRGVLQPVGVLPAENGRHRLVFGARRLRASKLAEQADIPAVIVPEAQRDLATQVIENQQRANLSNSDLAAVVNQLFEQGMKLKQIGAVCHLPEYLVSYYRGTVNLPPFLAAKIDHADIRAIYELSRAWAKHAVQVEQAVKAQDGFLSVTEARRIIEAATGKTTSSVYLRTQDLAGIKLVGGASADGPKAVEPLHSAKIDQAEQAVATQDMAQISDPLPRLPVIPAEPPAVVVSLHSAKVDQAKGAAAGSVSRNHMASVHVAAGAPVLIVELPDGRQGTLITTEGTGSQGERGTVLVDVADERIEVAFVDLRPASVG